MKFATIQAEKRTALKKGGVNRLRRQGFVPAVVYGAQTPNINVAISDKELRKADLGSGQVFKAVVAGERDYSVLIREVQRDPVSHEVTHLDLLEVSLTERLITATGLLLAGEAKGVSEGGILQYGVREVEIECLPTDIPEAITVDVSSLEAGENIKVGDLAVPAGVTILTDPEQVIVSVVAPQYEEAKEDEAREDLEIKAAGAAGESD